MPNDQQPVYLCAMREYNHDYYTDDTDNEMPLWAFVTERFVAARNADRAEWLFIEQLTREAEQENNLHGQGTSYMPSVNDRLIEVIDWTGQWQKHYSPEEFMHKLITDPEDAPRHD